MTAEQFDYHMIRAAYLNKKMGLSYTEYCGMANWAIDIMVQKFSEEDKKTSVSPNKGGK